MIARLLQFAEQAEAYTAWSDRVGRSQLQKTPMGIPAICALGDQINE